MLCHTRLPSISLRMVPFVSPGDTMSGMAVLKPEFWERWRLAGTAEINRNRMIFQS